MTKWVYSFGDGKAEEAGHATELLGGKGAGLAEMSRLGLPVSPGFTIITQVCSWYETHNHTYPEELHNEVLAALDRVGRLTRRRFGDAGRPLLLSARSGARVSMPGMMDTVLNIGLNDKTVEALAAGANAAFAYDCYRRFIQMYCDVVLGMDQSFFEDILDTEKARHGYEADTEMTAANWQDIIVKYKACMEEEVGQPFPQDPQVQLWGAIRAVFSSWMTQRAITYRRLHSIPEEWGTAVSIQAMVFGNMGNDSATGVAFTRNPATGENALYGEFLLNAQGEDVVSGMRTPQNISEVGRISAGSDKPSLEKLMPVVFADLQQTATMLEAHYRDMQDIEFTIEEGKLWMLQTRKGKRTAQAAVKIAVDMADAGLITREEAVMRVEPAVLGQLQRPVVDGGAERVVIATGLAASPGAAIGEIVFSADDAETAEAEGRSVVLVRPETRPEDIHGINAASAILTTCGGATSHAAVIARGLGKPCISGAGNVRIMPDNTMVVEGGKIFRKGDVITIDGDRGEVLAGSVPLLQPALSADFARLLQWAEAARHRQGQDNAGASSDIGAIFNQPVCEGKTGGKE